MNMMPKMLIALSVAVAVAAGSALAEETTSYDPPVELDLVFNFHIDDDLPEHDVFVEREPGSGLVYRPTKGERDMSLPVYTPATAIEYNPFVTDNVGPWKKGKALGITLGQWFAAKGKGKYSCKDGQGHIRIDFTKLVPNAVYTMWHDFLAWPLTEPYIGFYDLPFGARDGSESMFRTDAQGGALFERTFKPCLQLSGEQLVSDLAIAWHSNGKTYGAQPGEFTTNTHVHLYLTLPKRSGI